MTIFKKLTAVVCAPVLALAAMTACVSAPVPQVAGAAAGPDTSRGSEFAVLKPIQSGDLTLFPVVRANGKSMGGDAFLTLDEGLRSGEVEVTEAGNVRGLVRSRGGVPANQPYRGESYRGDQVNTLVLVNRSSRPLLLLAGEIVTGGKQDRIVASDRIVPADSDPVDLSVFCIEHGRWTETSDKFGVTAKSPAQSFMVQPQVRQQAMVAKSQQQVWNSVSDAVTVMAEAAAPPAPARVRQPSMGAAGGVGAISESNASAAIVGGMPPATPPRSLGTTSYAKAMANGAVSQKVDEAAPELAKANEGVLTQLKQEHAVGVVVAVHGEIIWADIFADTGLLTRYWTKLVRSYAAEGLTDVSAPRVGHSGPMREPTQADAQRFLDKPMQGAETSKGEVGVYRTLEARTGSTEQFVLESLLAGLTEDVHVSRLKVKGAPVGPQPAMMD